MPKPREKHPQPTISTKKGIKVRSKLEKKIADELTALGVKYLYEKDKLYYSVPETAHVYTPDFAIVGKDFVIEVKGLLDSDTRKKMLYVQRSNPFSDIRFVFQRDNPIRKGSKTKYSDWATANGFKYAIGSVPEEWLSE